MARPSLVQAGFTVIELLVVVLIVAALSAVAIPVYLEQREKALDAEAKSEARAAQSAAEAIGQDNDGRYNGPGGISLSRLTQTEETLVGSELSVPVLTAESYTLRLTSETGNTFSVTRNSDGTDVLTCASADDGGCPADGTWE
jgi:type IV pilus assembly protein PilA